MLLLDLFCGGGLAADGYAQAGFEHIVGVDVVKQAYYPYIFIEADALTILNEGIVGDFGIIQDFDVIHASPPCQLFTRAKHLRTAQGGISSSLDLLTPTLALLRKKWNHKTWVVENVLGAKEIMGPDAVTVCGSAFGLQIQRHRLFLSNKPIVGTTCNHSVFPTDPISGKPRPWEIYHVPHDNIPKGGRTALSIEHGIALMGAERDMPWTTLKEGIPPVYTKFIGEQLK